jgi:hypothetical protein
MTKSSARHPLFGFMKGTVEVAEGVDLTEPADPTWGLDLDTFKQSLTDADPPRGIDPPLAALWWAGKGNWDQAHKIVQDENDKDSAWVHAYLHRVEGDLGNAGYWYRQAGKPVATGPLEAEWERMVLALIPERPSVTA